MRCKELKTRDDRTETCAASRFRGEINISLFVIKKLFLTKLHN